MDHSCGLYSFGMNILLESCFKKATRRNAANPGHAVNMSVSYVVGVYG